MSHQLVHTAKVEKSSIKTDLLELLFLWIGWILTPICRTEEVSVEIVLILTVKNDPNCDLLRWDYWSSLLHHGNKSAFSSTPCCRYVWHFEGANGEYIQVFSMFLK